MDKSEQINELAAALASAQAEIEDASKAKINPAFRSKYADLGAVWDACKPALVKHGLSVAQVFVPSEPGFLALETVLLHKSGQYIAGIMIMPLAKQDPQGFGSATTYARRYALAAMVGVCPEDDDGNAATNRNGNHRFEDASPQAARSGGIPANNGNGPCPSCHAPAGRPHGSSCQAIKQIA